MIKAILFDMDGVLVDAKEWHFEALNRALGLFGLSISRYDHLVTYDGLPTKKKLEMLSLERGLPRKLHQFINDLKQQYTVELIHQHCKPVFCHQYALSRLRAAGYKIAVCSNSVRRTIDLMMEKSELSPYLDLILSNEDVAVAKPSPEIYLKAMKEFGVGPKDCLVFEDNPHGIQAAEASGAHVFRVREVTDVNWSDARDYIRRLEAAE